MEDQSIVRCDKWNAESENNISNSGIEFFDTIYL